MFASLIAMAVAGTSMNIEGAPSDFAPVVVKFIADEQDVQNKYWMEQYGPDRDRLMRLYSDTAKEIQQQNFAQLSRDGQLDYVLLHSCLETRMRKLEHEQEWSDKERPLLRFADAIFKLESDRRQAKKLDYEGIATTLVEVDRQIAKARLAAADHKPDRSVAYRAAQAIGQLDRCLDNWNTFYHGYDPQFDWWIASPLKSLKSSLASYRTFLTEEIAGVKENDPGAIFGSPVGRIALADELKGAMIDYSPEELIQIAEREYRWCESEMKKAAGELGLGSDWRAALEHVKQLHEQPGSQPRLIKELADEAVRYVRANDLVTVPPLAEEAWTMEMMSPARQLQSPFFLGGRNILISFPTDEMPQDQKEMSLKANNRYFCRATVFHELIPGHWLQQYSQARYHTYRSDLTNNPFWIEGWAFYWEMLLYNKDFVSKPEERIGMLFWRMHRCARVVFSLKFHLGEWTPQQCVDYLVDKVGHERFTAEGEVRRSLMGGYGALYQLAYMMGALQFRALHAELVESGRLTDRQFHDAVLHGNQMPVELVRASLTHQKIDRDFSTKWRFYPLAQG